jgi:hypothetical protein
MPAASASTFSNLPRTHLARLHVHIAHLPAKTSCAKIQSFVRSCCQLRKDFRLIESVRAANGTIACHSLDRGAGFPGKCGRSLRLGGTYARAFEIRVFDGNPYPTPPKPRRNSALLWHIGSRSKVSATQSPYRISRSRITHLLCTEAAITARKRIYYERGHRRISEI